MVRSVVAMNKQGRVTLPASARRQLGLTEGTQLDVAVGDGAITLRPTKVVLAEDAWAYTPENLAGIRRALDDAKAGRVYRLSWDDLDRAIRSGVRPAARRAARRPVRVVSAGTRLAAGTGKLTRPPRRAASTGRA